MAIRKALGYLKRFYRVGVLSILTVALILGSTNPVVTYAAATPSLGAAATYGILANTYTNSAAGTTVNGDVGFLVAPTVEPAPVGGHANYGSGPPYTAAGTSQATALAALDNEACTFTWPGAVDLFLDTLHGTAGTYTPGVYCSPGAFTQTGSITLSGSGTYIFRSVGAYTTTAGVSVNLAGGASACDVFWTTHATTFGAGTNFVGTVFDNDAVTAGAGTNILGRILAFNGPVTTATTTINLPTCSPPPATLHVIKQVVNNNGGSAVASNFTTHVKLAGIDVAGSPAAGAGTPGTSYSLDAGTYTISEDVNPSYTATFSGDCDIGGTVTLAAGEDKTCTITNDDRIATINVVKAVINDSGRTKAISDFPLFVSGTPVTSGATNTFAPGAYTVSETTDPDYTQSFSGDCDASGNLSVIPGDNKFCIVTNNDIAPVVVPPVPPLISVVKVPSPLSLPAGPGSATYTFTLTNLGTVTATNITAVDDSCSPLALVSGDTNANSQLEVSETWTYTCTATLSQTHTNNIVVTGLANGITAIDIASATVVVGSAVVPPLIHVTQVPNPPTLPVGGGTVDYALNITNPGTVPLTNVNLASDTCLSVNFISGDANGNSQLDTNETWVYVCSANLTKTTTSTVIASGMANGLTARDFAVATVVVGAVPGLPDAGNTPKD